MLHPIPASWYSLLPLQFIHSRMILSGAQVEPSKAAQESGPAGCTATDPSY
jgi:hypothetical protein